MIVKVSTLEATEKLNECFQHVSRGDSVAIHLKDQESPIAMMMPFDPKDIMNGTHFMQDKEISEAGLGHVALAVKIDPNLGNIVVRDGVHRNIATLAACRY